ncbi:hypothetical protein MRB53_037287 [Persea americana]|nr:hypothetical protein MRB53_037287 [Persea americana]
MSATTEEGEEGAQMERLHSIDSTMTESHYAVLPHGISLEGWSQEDKEELNDHVRHMLHSRRSKFRRGMLGFKRYVSQRWVSGGGRHDYDIFIIDNILVALFACVGDVLIPWRLRDTYHMIWIAHYHHLTWRKRKELGMAPLKDENELPRNDGHTQGRRAASADQCRVQRRNAQRRPHAWWEATGYQPASQGITGIAKGKSQLVVLPARCPLMTPILKQLRSPQPKSFRSLTPLQQKRFNWHATKFSNSHTFYKPHETTTHHAYPLGFMIAVVVLLDLHSCFQVALGTCTWVIIDANGHEDHKLHNRRHYVGEVVTTVILCFSLTSNILAGILVSIGDKRCRKKEVVERMFRQQLTTEALRKVVKRKKKARAEALAAQEAAGLDIEEDPEAEEEEKRQAALVLAAKLANEKESGKEHKDGSHHVAKAKTAVAHAFGPHNSHHSHEDGAVAETSTTMSGSAAQGRPRSGSVEADFAKEL